MVLVDAINTKDEAIECVMTKNICPFLGWCECDSPTCYDCINRYFENINK